MSFTYQALNIALNLSIKYNEKIQVYSSYVGKYNEHIQITSQFPQTAEEMHKHFVADLKVKDHLTSDIKVRNNTLYVHKNYLRNLIFFAQEPAPATQQSNIPYHVEQTLAQKAKTLKTDLKKERNKWKNFSGRLHLSWLCCVQNTINRKTDKIEALNCIYRCLTSAANTPLSKNIYKNSKRGLFSRRTANIVKEFENLYPEKKLSIN
jgi:hypothetical protein